MVSKGLLRYKIILETTQDSSALKCLQILLLLNVNSISCIKYSGHSTGLLSKLFRSSASSMIQSGNDSSIRGISAGATMSLGSHRTVFTLSVGLSHHLVLKTFSGICAIHPSFTAVTLRIPTGFCIDSFGYAFANRCFQRVVRSKGTSLIK